MNDSSSDDPLTNNLGDGWMAANGIRVGVGLG